MNKEAGKGEEERLNKVNHPELIEAWIVIVFHPSTGSG
jgi:hypothetical protein